MSKKKYKIAHEEYDVTPLTISPNHNAWPSKELIELMDGYKVGVKTFCDHKNYKLRWYIDYEIWDRATDHLLQKVEEKKDFIEQIYKKSIDIGKIIIEIQKHVESKSISTLTNKEISKLFKDLYNQANKLCIYGYIPVLADHVFNKFSNQLHSIIGNKLIGKKINLSVSEIVNILTTPNLLLPSKKLLLQKYRLSLKLKNFNGMIRDRKIEQLYQFSHWIDFGHLGPRMSINKFKKEINNLFKAEENTKTTLRELEKQSVKIKNKQTKLVKRLKLSGKEKYLFKVARRFGYLKGLRLDMLNIIYDLWEHLLNEISKRYDIEKDLLYYASVEELNNLLVDDKRLDKKLLTGRKKYCVWIAIDQHKQNILSGNEAKEYIKKHANADNTKIENLDILKGSVASIGYAKGRAKIVNSSKDIHKVKNGDILVSVATSPSVLPAMRKASAFVTDVGGLNSHAAIVAREFKKPCLIGVRQATKIFKDGDLIEVDTNKESVRRINR